MRGLEEMDLNQLREKLNNLAVAHEEPVVRVERDALGQLVPKAIEDAKAIVGVKPDGKIVSVKVASKDYAIIQHPDAFGAVIDALSSMNADSKVRASVIEEKGRAWLTVVFPEMKVNDGADGIELGFKVTNSIDKTSALKYTSNAKHTESTGQAGDQVIFREEESHFQEEKSHFEFFGYRLRCMNGMTMKVAIDWNSNPNIVPRGQAQVKKYIDAQTKHAKQKQKQEVRKTEKEKQTRLTDKTTDSPIPPAPKVAGILG